VPSNLVKLVEYFAGEFYLVLLPQLLIFCFNRSKNFSSLSPNLGNHVRAYCASANENGGVAQKQVVNLSNQLAVIHTSFLTINILHCVKRAIRRLHNTVPAKSVGITER